MGKSEKKSKEKKQHKDKSRRKDDRKKSKHRSKQSRSNSKDAYDPVDSLSIMLTHGLLMFPDLQEDIPAMLIGKARCQCLLQSPSIDHLFLVSSCSNGRWRVH